MTSHAAQYIHRNTQTGEKNDQNLQRHLLQHGRGIPRHRGRAGHYPQQGQNLGIHHLHLFVGFTISGGRMSGYTALLMQRTMIRRLGGHCIQVNGGVLARNGEKHADCSTCKTQCESAALGFSGSFEVGRVFGGDAIELRWSCPGCGRRLTQETTALNSIQDANTVKADPLCHKCRK